MNKQFPGRTCGSVSLRVAILTALQISTASALLASESNELEEVTVTAQKREQSALEVPITVNVFSAAEIEKTGALNLAEMQDFIPGFEVGESPTQSSLTIRGVSSANISTGGDPSVATFYDEVYIPRAATSLAFSDMQRIEVLKGPQGTLYGRNALVGVVNMVPSQPGEETEGFVRARLGNYGLWRVEAMGNVAVSDNFYLRGNILSNNRDGYVTNTEGGTDPGSQDNLVARLAGLWTISDSTQLQFAYDYDKVDNAARGAIGVSEWSACPGDPFCGRVSNDVISGVEGRDMQAFTGKLFHDFSERLSTKFIASYREFDTVNRQDEDGTAEFDRYLDTDNIEDSDIFYSEWQFNYEGDNYFLVFGANYSKENTYQEIPVNTNADSAMRAVTSGIRASTGIPIDHIWDPNQMAVLMSILTQQPISPEMIIGTGDFFYDQLDFFLPGTPVIGPSFAGQPWSEIYYNSGDFTNYGIYGDIDFQVTDRLSAIVGLRYSWDKKSFSWRNPPATINEVRPGTDDLVFLPFPGYEEARTGTLEASDDWSKLTGRAVLNYQINDEILTFLSYSTGYRSGAYDSLNPTTSDNPLPPAESTNYEWGVKGGLFNGRLATEFSLFYLELENRQRTVDSKPPGQPQAVPRVITGDQDIKGAELVLNWLITESTQLGFLTTWRDQESVWAPFYNANGELVEETGSGTTGTDYTFTFDWFPQISRGDLAIRAEYIFNENNDEFDPTIVDPNIPGFGEDRKLLNARIAWTSDDGVWTFGVWGKNLLDNEVTSGINNISLFSFQTPFVSIDPPRTYGIEASYQF
jgi:iron complex outermembrane receptor protein